MKKTALLILILLTAAWAAAGQDKGPLSAVYLGVADYGAPATVKANLRLFRYRFLIDGAEVLLRIDPGEGLPGGGYAYPIQNLLKEGYPYLIGLREDTVVSAEPLPVKDVPLPPRRGIPGRRTLGNFLRTASDPVGTALYVYGGGWDWQDEGASVQARTIGVSPDWVRFFNGRDEYYTYKEKDGDKKKADPRTSYYPYGGYNAYYYAGLDCSGYLGWTLYNVFETDSGKAGRVGSATGFAKRLAESGLGSLTRSVKESGKGRYILKPGDVVSISGHVWISLGVCADNSVVILHSSPGKSRKGQPGGGVQISAIGASRSCEACRLADKYMARQHPEWYRRYPVMLVSPSSYLAFKGADTGRFTWDLSGRPGGLTDPDGVARMTPAEALEFIYRGR
ncbi:MAG: hypothetical protein IK083_02885 [Abditibacteriota bacterium]|nr:hypothetical protein [Abditibacteriota bacterium]